MTRKLTKPPLIYNLCYSIVMFLLTLAPAQAERLVHFKVIDSAQAPVAGVSVALKRLSRGTSINNSEETWTTDRNGAFTAELSGESYMITVDAKPTFRGYRRAVSIKYATEIIISLRTSAPSVDDAAVLAEVKSQLAERAGKTAHDCGINYSARSKASHAAYMCVDSCLRRNLPFRIIYEEPGVDSLVITALAQDTKGNFYELTVDTSDMLSRPYDLGQVIANGWKTCRGLMPATSMNAIGRCAT